MSLPASLVQQVEQHGCFTGCYGIEADARICTDPNRPMEPVVLVSCQDCLSFKVGALRSLLPAGNNTCYWLASELSRHVKTQRGYALAFAGYHARGPGFWLSAAYYSRCGLFLLDGERSRGVGTDLDLLLMAFQHGVVPPPDPGMLNPRQFATQVVYVDYSKVVGPVLTRQQLLASPQCQLQPRPGFRRVTLAEYQPIARAAAAAPPVPAQSTAAAAAPRVVTAPTAARPLKVGDICPVCKAEVRLRPLLNKTYVGCLC